MRCTLNWSWSQESLGCALSLVLCGFGQCTGVSCLKLCLYTVVHFLLEEFPNFSEVVLKYASVSHNKSQSRSQSLLLGLESGPSFLGRSRF